MRIRIVVVEVDGQTRPMLDGGWIPPQAGEPYLWVLWVPKGTVVGP